MNNYQLTVTSDLPHKFCNVCSWECASFRAINRQLQTCQNECDTTLVIGHQKVIYSHNQEITGN